MPMRTLSASVLLQSAHLSRLWLRISRTTPEHRPRSGPRFRGKRCPPRELLRRNACFMYFLRVLLLAALSFGMQVPGGMAFEFCLCQGLTGLFHSHRAGEGSGGCCAKEGEAQACVGGDCSDGSERIAKTRNTEDCSGCFEVTTPKHPPCSKSPARISIVPPFVTSFVVACLTSTLQARCIPAADRSHDPPWERRNLPLRI
jgi:hypothetical protein